MTFVATIVADALAADLAPEAYVGPPTAPAVLVKPLSSSTDGQTGLTTGSVLVAAYGVPLDEDGLRAAADNRHAVQGIGSLDSLSVGQVRCATLVDGTEVESAELTVTAFAWHPPVARTDVGMEVAMLARSAAESIEQRFFDRRLCKTLAAVHVTDARLSGDVLTASLSVKARHGARLADFDLSGIARAAAAEQIGTVAMFAGRVLDATASVKSGGEVDVRLDLSPASR